MPIGAPPYGISQPEAAVSVHFVDQLPLSLSLQMILSTISCDHKLSLFKPMSYFAHDGLCDIILIVCCMHARWFVTAVADSHMINIPHIGRHLQAISSGVNNIS